MNNPTFKIFLKNKPNKDLTFSVCLRFTVRRKTKIFYLGIKILPEHWFPNDAKKIKKDSEHFLKNEKLRIAEKTANEIIIRYENENKLLTIERFEREFKNKSISEITDFYQLISTEIDKRNLSPDTKHTYRTQISKLKRFRKKLDIDEINENFVNAYIVFMVNNLDNKPITYNKTIAILKVFLNWLVDAGTIKENPIQKFKTKKIEGKRNYLTGSELDILIDLYRNKNLSEGKKNVLKYFLFSCFTGLRFTDMKNLRKKDFYTEIIENKTIYFVSVIMHKTKQNVTIPVIPKALELIELDSMLEYEFVFNVRCNQITNRRLKEIIQLTAINKNISFHCARHTFATIGLNKEIPIEVISKMLGHTELKTTQIYAKVTQENKYKQMLKMQ